MFEDCQYICAASESVMPISLYSSYAADPEQISLTAIELPSAGQIFSIRVSDGGLFSLVEDWRERIEKLCISIVQTVTATVRTAVRKAVRLPIVSYTVYKKTAIFRAMRKLRL